MPQGFRSNLSYKLDHHQDSSTLFPAYENTGFVFLSVENKPAESDFSYGTYAIDWYQLLRQFLRL